MRRRPHRVFSFELDGLGVAEEDHVIVKAPQGTYFVPNMPRDKQDGVSKFHIVRTVLDMKDKWDSASEPEAEVLGALSPGHVSAEGTKRWYDLDGKDENGAPHCSVPSPPGWQVASRYLRAAVINRAPSGPT